VPLQVAARYNIRNGSPTGEATCRNTESAGDLGRCRVSNEKRRTVAEALLVQGDPPVGIDPGANEQGGCVCSGSGKRNGVHRGCNGRYDRNAFFLTSMSERADEFR
jgi:hypothetical protein